MLIIVSLIALAISFGGGRTPPDLLGLQPGQIPLWISGSPLAAQDRPRTPLKILLPLEPGPFSRPGGPKIATRPTQDHTR